MMNFSQAKLLKENQELIQEIKEQLCRSKEIKRFRISHTKL